MFKRVFIDFSLGLSGVCAQTDECIRDCGPRRLHLSYSYGLEAPGSRTSHEVERPGGFLS